MKTESVKKQKMREIALVYMKRLKRVAKKRGFLSQLNELIEANKRNECQPTEYECEMLARAVDEERLARQEIPEILGKSYRECVEDDDFALIKKLKRVGIYSRVSTLLLSSHHKKQDS